MVVYSKQSVGSLLSLGPTRFSNNYETEDQKIVYTFLKTNTNFGSLYFVRVFKLQLRKDSASKLIIISCFLNRFRISVD